MPRDLQINIYHECDITHVPVPMRHILDWCEQHMQHGWNIVADSGAHACRGSGEHRVVFLCDHAVDVTYFKLHWLNLD